MNNKYDDEYLNVIEEKDDTRVYFDGKSKSLDKYISRLKKDVVLGRVTKFIKTRDGYYYEILNSDSMYSDYKVILNGKNTRLSSEVSKLCELSNSPRVKSRSVNYESSFYTDPKKAFKRNLVNYSGYADNLIMLQFGMATVLLLGGLVGKLFLTNITMVIALGIIGTRVGYVLYKTINSTKEELNINGNKSKRLEKEKKEIVPRKKEEKSKKKEVTREIKQDKTKEKTVSKKTTEVKKVTPVRNVSDKELTLSYLKNEYRRLYLEREKMIKNNCSKDEIKAISERMEEVGGRAFRIEMGEDLSYNKGMSMKIRK